MRCFFTWAYIPRQRVKTPARGGLLWAEIGQVHVIKPPHSATGPPPLILPSKHDEHRSIVNTAPPCRASSLQERKSWSVPAAYDSRVIEFTPRAQHNADSVYTECLDEPSHLFFLSSKFYLPKALSHNCFVVLLFKGYIERTVLL